MHTTISARIAAQQQRGDLFEAPAEAFELEAQPGDIPAITPAPDAIERATHRGARFREEAGHWVATLHRKGRDLVDCHGRTKAEAATVFLDYLKRA